jgi:trehalose utilization protein
MIQVTVWNEYYHEREKEHVAAIYPKGIHGCIAEFLQSDEILVRTACLDDPECGLSQEVIENTDVLLWWGHVHHPDVPDEIVRRVTDAVHSGMGIIFLHSAHHSKPFQALMGTPCHLHWRDDGDKERIWICDPSHPIVQGVEHGFTLEQEETYCEPFSVPEPDELLMIGSYAGGEVFRAGCCYKRGYGKVFYFQPGHEEYPTFYNANVQTIIQNAVYWAAPVIRRKIDCPKISKQQ